MAGISKFTLHFSDLGNIEVGMEVTDLIYKLAVLLVTCFFLYQLFRD